MSLLEWGGIIFPAIVVLKFYVLDYQLVQIRSSIDKLREKDSNK